MNKYYCCLSCGNVFEVLTDSGVNPVCCGDSMKLVKANSDEAGSIEKHIPVFKKDGNLVTIEVGDVLHPMLKSHFIEWIELETNKGVYRRNLTPDDEPVATFIIGEGETISHVYAFCNIHGLWVA